MNKTEVMLSDREREIIATALGRRMDALEDSRGDADEDLVDIEISIVSNLIDRMLDF